MRKTCLTLICFVIFFGFAGCAVHDDPQYPINDSGLVVDDSLSVDRPHFYWLDNHRIITQTRGRIVDNPVLADYKKIGLVIFDTDTNQISTLIAPVKADSARLCVSDKSIVFRHMEWGVESGTSYLGEIDQDKNVINIAPNGPFDELDSFTCQSASVNRLPEWAKNIPKLNIHLLKPEHGFVFVDQDTDKWGVPVSRHRYKPTEDIHSVRLYKLDGSEKQGVDLPIIPLDNDNPNNTYYFQPRYYEFKDAYLIYFCCGKTPIYWL